MRSVLEEQKLDALLISDFYNILYLTGFKTLTDDEREAFVLVTGKDVYLFTDARYSIEDPHVKLKMFKPGKGLSFHLNQIVTTEKLQRVGIEADHLTVLEYNYLAKKVVTTFIPTERILVSIREIKDKEEIASIKKACEIGDEVLSKIAPLISINMTEREIGFRMEVAIKEQGYGLAFDPIVAIDANSAIPHYDSHSGRAVVKKRSVILMDFGVKYQDYLSDITRMFFFGQPLPEVTGVYNSLLDAQQRTVERMKEITLLSDLDQYCRGLLEENQLPFYPHSTGHGVGLEIHEFPKVSLGLQDKKKDGQVVTIEPGVYLPGKFGMRIEDTVVVEKGKAVCLTNFSKDMRILGG